MLPIVLRSENRRAVVVGGGSVASRKVETLAEAGCTISVVAPAVDPSLRAMLTRLGADVRERKYRSGDLQGAAIAVAATGDDAVDRRVVDDARLAGVLVCDATDPERGDFTMPATLRIDDLTISVDTGGGAPAFSKRVVREASALFGPQYGRAAKRLARMRAYVKALLPKGERRSTLQALAELPVSDLAAMNDVEAEHEVEATIARLRNDGRSIPPARTVTCASRGSALAMAQTRSVAARLAERGLATTILSVTTSGDRDRTQPIEKMETVNVFVKELEIALREGRADYAVHSCKDLPSELPSDMQIAAISKREDPRDAFCSERFADFESLPAGAIVGTSSPRRREALLALRPDLQYRDLRGNVDTRLRKLRDGEFDAIVIAMAGLLRLRTRATHTVPFSVERLVPAVGQGALAIETRAGNELARELNLAIEDVETAFCVSCERAALRAMRAGCSAPVGIHARLVDGEMWVDAFFLTESGLPRRTQLRARVNRLDAAEALGLRMAERAQTMMAMASPLSGRMLVLPRTQERPSRIADALRKLGAEVVELRVGDAGPDPAERIPDMLLFPSTGAVAVAEAYLERLRTGVRKPLVAAIGPRSAEAARAAGFAPDAVASEAQASQLVSLALQRLGDVKDAEFAP